MTRYVAFLRAINVGGHNVAMSVLKHEFEKLGLVDVETFIASGNVIFKSRVSRLQPLEAKIERALEAALGYQISTFLRSEQEVAAVAAHQAFDAAAIARSLAFSVGFVAQPLSAAACDTLRALETDKDTFHVNGREIYWLSTAKQSESKISNAVIERALKGRSTFRGINTVVRLATKLSSQPAAKPR